MEMGIFELIEKNEEKVRAVLNILLESAYFYEPDSEDCFRYLYRYRREFFEFYKKFYDWDLIIDSKCARLYKGKWYNDSIKLAAREQFGFRRRDECIAFMCFLEFYEKLLEENNMTAEQKDNPMFKFGDLLFYCKKRFNELFPQSEVYTEEFIRSDILRGVMPQLEKFRFIVLQKPDSGLVGLQKNEYIYEALPACHHYNHTRLSSAVFDDENSTATSESESIAEELDSDSTEFDKAAEKSGDVSADTNTSFVEVSNIVSEGR